MAIPDPIQLTAALRRMSDQQLMQYGQMHKNDPYIFPMVIAEDTARKQMRAQGAASTPVPSGTVADQSVMAMQQPQQPQPAPGIAALQAPNMQGMADGGIAGYADDEEVASYAPGGVTKADTSKTDFIREYQELAQKVSAETGVSPELILAQWGQETAWGKKTVGKYNFGNIKDVTGKGPIALDKMEGSRSSYKSYKTPEEFAADYTRLLKSNFPNALGAGADVNKFTAGLSSGTKGVYATDPDYGKKIAAALTSVIPISSAIAAEAPLKAEAATRAPAAPALPSLSADQLKQARAGQIPGSPVRFDGREYTWEGKPVKEYKEPSFGQKVLGAGETALSLASAVPALVLGGAQTAQQAISQGRRPTEQEFTENVGRFTYAPRTEAGQEMLGGTAEVLGQLPPYIGGPAVSMPSRAVAAQRAAREAEVAAQKAAPRLTQAENIAGPRTGMTAGERVRADEAALAAFKQDQAAAAVAAERAALEGVRAERAAQNARYAAGVEQRAGLAGAATNAAQAANAANIAQQGQAAPIAVTPDFARPDTTEAAPEVSAKELIKDLKSEAPAEVKATAKKEGWTNDDWLTFGFSLLGSKSPYFSEALGTAGLAALAGQKARRKTESEEAKEASEALYRERLGEKAKAETAYLSDMRGPAQAYQMATKALAEWEKNVPQLKQMDAGYPAEREAQYRKFLQDAFTALGLETPSGLTSPAAGQLPAIPKGVTVRQLGG